MTYQPQPGDRVTVTTQTLTGRFRSRTGIYQPAGSPDRFLLDGEVMASPAFIRQHHDVSRTITPAPIQQENPMCDHCHSKTGHHAQCPKF